MKAAGLTSVLALSDNFDGRGLAAAYIAAGAFGRGHVERMRPALARHDALARFRDPELFDSLLASTLTDDVRPQDGPFLLATATTNRDLGERAWRFIADNWGLSYLTPRIAKTHNFEHVFAASPAVAGLLESAPELRVLVTSRMPLHLRAERALAPLL